MAEKIEHSVLNSLPSDSQLVNAIPEIVRFRPAQPVTHFSKTSHAHNAHVLYLCRLCIEPLKERDRTAVFREQDHLCSRQAQSPSIALLRLFRCLSIAILQLSVNRPQLNESEGLIVDRGEISRKRPGRRVLESTRLVKRGNQSNPASPPPTGSTLLLPTAPERTEIPSEGSPTSGCGSAGRSGAGWP